MKKYDIFFLIAMLVIFPEIVSAHTMMPGVVFYGIIITGMTVIYSLIQFIIRFWKFSNTQYTGGSLIKYRILIYVSSMILLPGLLWGGFFITIYLIKLPIYINLVISILFLYFFPKLIGKSIELYINTPQKALVLGGITGLLLFSVIIEPIILFGIIDLVAGWSY